MSTNYAWKHGDQKQNIPKHIKTIQNHMFHQNSSSEERISGLPDAKAKLLLQLFHRKNSAADA